MTLPQGVADDAFVGRVEELEVLDSALASARAGHGRAVLVSGDAGVGKTRLVHRACATADDVLVLAGACLPLSTLSIPLLPLRSALAGWAEGGADTASQGLSGEDAAEGLDRWLEARCRQGAVALVVDDLQWADQGTLDVLMWLVSGLANRRLAILATVRRGEVGPEHPMTRWLADVRRLPGFVRQDLGPLALEETRQQLSTLLGDEPHDALVRQVHDRTGGNAYLNQLLVAGLSPTATSLSGRALPEDLTSAVLRAWLQLSPAARELTRVLAVGGTVARGPTLATASRLAGVEDAGPLLRECVEAGILDVHDSDGYWFHHPLQAEALEAGLAAPERTRLHAAFAEALCDRHHKEAADLATAILMTDHLHRAGDEDGTYAWAVRAADAAEHDGSWGDVVRLLHRAVEALAELGRPETEACALWERLRDASLRAGDLDGELEATEALLDHTAPEARVAAELVVRRQHLRFMTGRGFFDREELARAVELSGTAPDSWQHAFALAEAAHAALWAEDPAAPGMAVESLARARACGHPRALSYALTANAMHAVITEDMARGRAWGSEGVACAALAGDGFAFGHATMWEANAMGGPADPRWGASVAARRSQGEDLGLPHPYLAWLAVGEAQGELQRGSWRACQALLRSALGRTPGALVDVGARLQAAELAALQGRVHEAQGHLARADELFAETSTFLPFEFDAVRARVRLAAGDLRGCVDAALVGATTPGVSPTMAEWLLPLAVRALADLAQEQRDARADPGPLVREVDALEQRFPHTIQDAGGDEAYYRQLEGLDALYAAERGRARLAPDRVHAWEVTADLLRDVLPWDECYARWRLAEALFDAGPTRRGEAVEALRRAQQLALDLQAVPILERVASLARSARVPLAEPLVTAAVDGRPHAGAHLTAREEEVLAHVVAGRTYGEIARTLVVSEKTVSTHVSHLLAKTGTANRVDLARWAARRGAGAATVPATRP
ncbi:helix-turn-helix transcriptional regulator [Pedococcus sp. 2YAF34]|uniref:helix-turn-helix transcriptional regulator n=1 Tax=Pedococcus sp. 2YAF34 TaxID=3233032 RepID=UPI003F9B9BEA